MCNSLPRKLLQRISMGLEQGHRACTRCAAFHSLGFCRATHFPVSVNETMWYHVATVSSVCRALKRSYNTHGFFGSRGQLRIRTGSHRDACSSIRCCVQIDSGTD